MAQTDCVNVGIWTSKVICHSQWQSTRYDNPRYRTYAYRMRLSSSCGFFVRANCLKIEIRRHIPVDSKHPYEFEWIIFCFELLHLVCALETVAVSFAGCSIVNATETPNSYLLNCLWALSFGNHASRNWSFSIIISHDWFNRLAYEMPLPLLVYLVRGTCLHCGFVNRP